MSQDNFSLHGYDLGTDKTQGIDRHSIDTMFKLVHSHSAHTCIVCTNTAQFKLIPKHERLNTAEIEDKGFLCEHCLQQQYFNPKDYGIRPIDTNTNVGGNWL